MATALQLFEATTPPIIPMYGEADDHLRTSVLLAESFMRLGDQDGRGELEACFSPGTDWRGRQRALRSALERQRRRGVSAEVSILSASLLPQREPSAAHRWDDDTFEVERWELGQLLNEYEDAVVLVEPSRARREFAPTGDAALDGLLLTLDPVIARLCVGLLWGEVLKPKELCYQIEGAKDEGRERESLLMLAYGSLGRRLEEALKLYAHGRTPQARLALYSFGPRFNELGFDALTAELSGPLEVLESLGWVGGGVPWLEGSLREFVLSCCMGSRWKERSKRIHQQLAALNVGEERSEALERHYHAIKARDVEQAIESARFYRSDLRLLAKQLSQDGRFEDAARLYKSILEATPDDAYAAEYLAYNLARAESDDRATILRSYQHAATLDGENPLYQGRLLGWRFEMGEPVEGVKAEFIRLMDHFASKGGNMADTEGMSWFARPVRDSLTRSKRLEQWDGLIGHRSFWRELVEPKLNHKG